MPGIGNSFTYNDLGSCSGGNSTVALAGAGSPVADKVTLVSVVDISRGTAWLNVLNTLCGFSDPDIGFPSLPGNVTLLTILFSRSGGEFTDPGYLAAAAAVGGYTNLLANSILQRDNGTYVGTELVADYPGTDIDSDDDCYWCYFVGKNGTTAGNFDNAVADIWRRDVIVEDADDNPISTLPLLRLEKTGNPVTGFDAAGNPLTGGSDPVTFTPLLAADHDNYNIRAFFIQLLKNLAGTPRVLTVSPEINTWRSEMTESRIYFSQPVDPVNAASAANYQPGGTAAGGLSVDGQPTYSQLDNGANIAIISLSGAIDDSLDDEHFQIDVTVPPNTYGIAAAAGDTPVNLIWSADITPPEVSFDSPSDPKTNADSLTVILTAVNDSGGSHNTKSDLASYYFRYDGLTSLPDSPTDLWPPPPAEFPWSLGSDGEKTASVWVEDTAGNISPRTDVTVTKYTVPPNIENAVWKDHPCNPYKKLISFTVSSNAPDGLFGWKITESSDDSVTTEVSGGAIADEDFEFPITSTEGLKDIYIRAVDTFGNYATQHLEVVLDLSAPDVEQVELNSLSPSSLPDVSITIPSALDPDVVSGTPGTGVVGCLCSLEQPPATTADREAWCQNGNDVTPWDGLSSISLSYSLDGEDWGLKTLYVWVWDAVFNISVTSVSLSYQMKREIMLALDFSGSMRGQVFFDYEGQEGLVAGDYSKYAVLKSSVNWFVDLLKAWDGDNGIRGVNDSIGGYVFRDHLELLQSPLPIDDGTTNGGDDLKAALLLHPEPQSGQLTAMGAGMAQALIELDYRNDDNTAGAHRALLVVTDGMQNRLPVLTVNEPETDVIDVTIDAVNSGGINTFKTAEIQTTQRTISAVWTTQVQSTTGKTRRGTSIVMFR